MDPDFQSKDPRPVGVLDIGRHHANPVIRKRKNWFSLENMIVVECYLLSEPKVRGYRKCLLSLWLDKNIFWVSEKRLVVQANTFCRNSWMTELEIEELERNLAENDSYKEQKRSADDTGNNLREGVRDILNALEADEQIDSLEEEEVPITKEIAEVLERRQKNKVTSFQRYTKEDVIRTFKIDKVLFKFKTHNITKTNELFYAGVVLVTNKL